MLATPEHPTIPHGLPAGADTGCTCAPCSRCRARMAMFYASGRDGIPRYRAVRRVQALRAIGYTPELLSRVLGVATMDLQMLTYDDRRHVGVYRSVFARIAAGYAPLSAAPVDDLADTRPWPSPLAWDDIDDALERPHRDGRWCELEDCDCLAEHSPKAKYHDTVDPIAVFRVMHGELVPTTRAEKEVITAEWLAAGRTWDSLESFTGWHLENYKMKDGTAA